MSRLGERLRRRFERVVEVAAPYPVEREVEVPVPLEVLTCPFVTNTGTTHTHGSWGAGTHAFAMGPDRRLWKRVGRAPDEWVPQVNHFHPHPDGAAVYVVALHDRPPTRLPEFDGPPDGLADAADPPDEDEHPLRRAALAQRLATRSLANEGPEAESG